MIAVEYQLIVEHPSTMRPTSLRSMDEYDSREKLIVAAADYEAGEYGPAQVVGAFSLTFSGSLLISCETLDISKEVAEDLRARPEYQRIQRALARNDARNSV